MLLTRLFTIMLIAGFVAAGCTQEISKQKTSKSELLHLKDFSDNNLPSAQEMGMVELSGEAYELKAEVVKKELFGKKQVMFAYNRQIPGPVLKVNQGDIAKIRFVNELPFETTVHWHGLRHDNKYDGVPEITQEAVKPGKFFDYELYFPDYGVYWYHPHVREDLQQESGLAGLIIVKPKEHDNVREEVLVLDDLAIMSGEISPFGRAEANHALMGRFGNIILANGKRNYSLEAKIGETIRIYVANIANARPFNLTIDKAKIKIIGSDMSYYEKEHFADSVIIAPAERYIIEIQFEEAGNFQIRSVNNVNTRLIGNAIITKGDEKEKFELKLHSEVSSDVESLEKYFYKEADYEFELLAELSPEIMQQMNTGTNSMPCHQMPDGSMMGDCKQAEHTEKIEWEDNMGMMNEMSNPQNVKWTIKDTNTGFKNMDIPLRAKVGDKIKIILHNNAEGMHSMQHPIHLHGQRFLVLNVNGVTTENHVWKDTVLVQTGEKIEILVDVTNPGKWMMHCHIAEHLESGMMTMMNVAA